MDKRINEQALHNWQYPKDNKHTSIKGCSISLVTSKMKTHSKTPLAINLAEWTAKAKKAMPSTDTGASETPVGGKCIQSLWTHTCPTEHVQGTLGDRETIFIAAQFLRVPNQKQPKSSTVPETNCRQWWNQVHHSYTEHGWISSMYFYVKEGRVKEHVLRISIYIKLKRRPRSQGSGYLWEGRKGADWEVAEGEMEALRGRHVWS